MTQRHIVIIGSGFAGMSAALRAAEGGAKVTLVSAQPAQRSESVMAEGGINAALDPYDLGDSVQLHQQETLASACGIASLSAVKGLTETAPLIVNQLAKAGCAFNRREDGRIDARYFGGQSLPRAAFAQTATGKQIVTAMSDQLRRHQSAGVVKALTHHLYRSLLISDEPQGPVCRGVVIKDMHTLQETAVECDAVIACAGAMNGLFNLVTGSSANRGYVAADLFSLGVRFSNCEFIQFHPTTTRRGSHLVLISEAARAEGGRLCYLKDGNPVYYMEEMHPELGRKANLLTRDVLARETYNLGVDTQAYLDMRQIPLDVFSTRLGSLVKDCEGLLGVDPRKQLIPVAPGIHYFMGGICVDSHHRSSLAGLYAAGGCCAQYHGANRLGGNSILGAIYGGSVAAESALSGSVVDSANAPRPQKVRHTPDDLMSAVRDALDVGLGVVRDAQAIRKAEEMIPEDSGAEALLARACLACAAARTESRGAHFRSDYPHRNDEEFLASTVAWCENGKIIVDFQEVDR